MSDVIALAIAWGAIIVGVGLGLLIMQFISRAILAAISPDWKMAAEYASILHEQLKIPAHFNVSARRLCIELTCLVSIEKVEPRLPEIKVALGRTDITLIEKPWLCILELPIKRGTPHKSPKVWLPSLWAEGG